MSDVLDLSANTWEKEISQSSGLVVVEFWRKECQWCKKMGPIYSEVAKIFKERLKFAKINVLENNENRNIAVKYGIMGTPTLVFFCEGRALETFLGFQQKERLKELVDDVINNHQGCIEKSTKLKTD